MTKNKQKIFAIAFGIFFFVVFFTLFMCILSKGYENEIDTNTFNCDPKQHFLIVLCGFNIIILATVICSNCSKIFNSKRIISIKEKDKKTKIIIFAVCGTMLLLQLLFGYLLAFKPVTDLEIVNNYAKNFASTGNFDKIQADFDSGKSTYMMRYPNNMALLLILSFVYRIDFLLTGYVSRYLPIIINCVLLNVSVLFTCLLARKVLGNKKALFTLLLCFFFAPFYTYAPYYYTDSFSLPFVVISLYTIVSAINATSKKKKYLLFALSGFLIFCGFKIKGSVIIILAAAIVYLFFKLKFKNFLIVALTVVVGFGVPLFTFNTIIKNSGIITKEQYYDYEYPPTHWVMMGLNTLGGYSPEDSKFTSSIIGKDNKVKAHLEEIKNRIDEYNSKDITKGEVTLISHLGRKVVWTWEDGTYYITHHIKKPINKYPFLRNYLDKNGKHHFRFVLYCCAYQLFLIFMMSMSGLKAIIEKKLTPTTLFRIVVFFTLVFFSIWEARSRYLFNVSPLFIILAADGIDFLPIVSRKLHKYKLFSPEGVFQD